MDKIFIYIADVVWVVISAAMELANGIFEGLVGFYLSMSSHYDSLGLSVWAKIAVTVGVVVLPVLAVLVLYWAFFKVLRLFALPYMKMRRALSGIPVRKMFTVIPEFLRSQVRETLDAWQVAKGAVENSQAKAGDTSVEAMSFVGWGRDLMRKRRTSRKAKVEEKVSPSNSYKSWSSGERPPKK
ncbi:hypothetical protein AB4571_02165 [Vibrio breoganii]|uniref:hypothetical protein n=1 Tax=Vibrio breoganii TaxID=553239 RepID=UPI000C868569|nr:hypothetical protein [Vibrio breoganii]PML12718.1 hypothetical protein BCT84_02215 [Vibrio breoganii]